MLKAKCPHCRDGCEECVQGYIHVGLKDGDWYTRFCPSCGEHNGVRISKTPPTETLGPCVFCGFDGVQWQKEEDKC